VAGCSYEALKQAGFSAKELQELKVRALPQRFTFC
jgi:hypothetical protein